MRTTSTIRLFTTTTSTFIKRRGGPGVLLPLQLVDYVILLNFSNHVSYYYYAC
jgi:hypothetical protein